MDGNAGLLVQTEISVYLALFLELLCLYAGGKKVDQKDQFERGREGRNILSDGDESPAVRNPHSLHKRGSREVRVSLW